MSKNKNKFTEQIAYEIAKAIKTAIKQYRETDGEKDFTVFKKLLKDQFDEYKIHEFVFELVLPFFRENINIFDDSDLDRWSNWILAEKYGSNNKWTD